MVGGKEADSKDIMPEEAIKAVLVCNGTKLGTVGFLSRSIFAVEKDKERWIGRFAQVIELVDHLANKTKRSMGKNSLSLLEDMQDQEYIINLETLSLFCHIAIGKKRAARKLQLLAR